MSTLSDLIGQAKDSASNQVRGVKSDVLGGITGAISNAKNNVQTGITSGIKQTINAGLTGVIGAAGDFLTGDFSGGFSKITNIGSDIGSALSKVTGLGSGSILTGGGGGGSVSSSNNGIAPGNGLAGITARADPLLNFLWYADMPMLMSSSGGAASSLPWYYVEEANVPFRVINTRSIFRDGRQRHYPGDYSVDALRLAIYADVNGVGLKYLQAWNNLVLNPTTSANQALFGGGYGRPADFKKSIKIYLLAANKQQLVELEYIECWPTTIESLPLSSGSSDRLVYHTTFSVGDVFMKIYTFDNAVSAASAASNFPQSIQGAIGATYAKITAPVFNAVASAANSAISSIFD